MRLPSDIVQQRRRQDFSLSRDALWDALQDRLVGVTREELDRWVDEERFESVRINGQKHFLRSSVSNLVFRYPELESRLRVPKDARQTELGLLHNARAIRQSALRSGRNYVLPKRFEVRMELELNPGVVPVDELIRAWLPVPRRSLRQQEIDWKETSSSIQALDGPESAIRALYLEQASMGTRATPFYVRYTFKAFGVWNGLNPDTIQYLGPEAGTLVASFLGEAPHVRFTRTLMELAESIAGHGTHPLVRARAYYDWISKNIRYSYAPEYSTAVDLADSCLRNGYGDCGQAALLFITLCRLIGIPARWQSGWSFFPGAQTIHDWCEIYLSPVGWVPVDPSMAIYARQYTRHLTDIEKEELAGFYFGGLTQYRMSANCDHSQHLTPKKADYRSDPVDFQRGEMETSGMNLYFDTFRYRFDWQEVTND